MSVLLNSYSKLKQENKNLVYLFKSGIFYIAIEEDAILLSKKLDLKLTKNNSSYIKCGFPISKVEKYKILLTNMNVNFKLVDSLSTETSNFNPTLQTKSLINLILSKDIDSLTILEAYKLL